MANRDGNAPAWLFSFVDLAFLMLIAMTQVASRATGPDLGEVLVPRLQTEASAELPSDARARWQLRVHPPEVDTLPFELLRAADASAPSGQLRLSVDADESWGSLRNEETASPPHNAAVRLAQRHDRLPRTAHLTDDRVLVGQRTGAVARLDHRSNQQRGRPEVGDEVP